MDAFVFAASIAELRHRLSGATVARILQPSPSALLLELKRQEATLLCLLSAEATLERLHLVKTPPPCPVPLTAFGQLVRKHLQGSCLEGIEQEGLERIAAFRFQGGGSGEVILYGELLGKDSNFILVEASSQRVLGMLKPRPGLEGLYTPPPTPRRHNPLAVRYEEFRGLILPSLRRGEAAWKALSEAFFGLSALIAKEVAFRAEPLGQPEEAVERLWHALQDILDVVRKAAFQPRLLLDGDYPLATAVFPLHSFPEAKQLPFESVGEAAERFYALKVAKEELSALRRRIAKRLEATERRLLRRKEQLCEEAARHGKAEEYKQMGQLLLAHKEAIRRGTALVELPDYSGSTLTIPLDPALSIQANAERYFRLVRKAKRGAVMAKERLTITEAELSRLATLKGKLERASDREALTALEQELPAPRPTPGEARVPRAEKAEGPVPRQFVSSDGLVILVGRSGRGNEHLTWKLASPHDLWLHAHGSPGSHVLVRLPKGSGIPSRTLEEAAKLAAYYSRARGRGKVEVAYTSRKYLRKPKKAKAGTVLLTQEKTILVEPDPSLVKKLAQPHLAQKS